MRSVRVVTLMEEERLAYCAGVLFVVLTKKNKCSKNLLHCQEKDDMIKQTHVLHVGRRHINI